MSHDSVTIQKPHNIISGFQFQTTKGKAKIYKARVPAVSVDGLDLPESDPEPERDHVAGDDGGPEERRDSEDQNLGPVSVRRGETHRSGVLVVDLVDILVAPLVVKKSVDPIVRVVFDHEVDEQLGQNFPSRRQWQPRSNPYHLLGRIPESNTKKIQNSKFKMQSTILL